MWVATLSRINSFMCLKKGRSLRIILNSYLLLCISGAWVPRRKNRGLSVYWYMHSFSNEINIHKRCYCLLKKGNSEEKEIKGLQSASGTMRCPVEQQSQHYRYVRNKNQSIDSFYKARNSTAFPCQQRLSSTWIWSKEEHVKTIWYHY